MRSGFFDMSTELRELFEVLVGRLISRGTRLALGADGPDGPYFQIVSPPERRADARLLTPSYRTTVRLRPYDAYVEHLQNTFPRLTQDFAAVCREGRAFLVVEGWLMYPRLGEILLDFARERGLNVRYVDFRHGESRLNGLRVAFDPDRHRWIAEEGSVEDLLRDPRDRRRRWTSTLDPRWRVGRSRRRMNGAGARTEVSAG